VTDIDKVARAILEASRMDLDWDLLVEHWGPDCFKIEELRAMAQAAVEAMGLRKEDAVRTDGLHLGHYTLPGQAKEFSQRPEFEGKDVHVVSRWVSPWVREDQ
jgi:hypothetical protein